MGDEHQAGLLRVELPPEPREGEPPLLEQKLRVGFGGREGPVGTGSLEEMAGIKGHERPIPDLRHPPHLGIDVGAWSGQRRPMQAISRLSET